MGDMGSPRPMVDILSEMEGNTKNKWSVIGMAPNITKEILKKHIFDPSKETNMIILS